MKHLAITARPLLSRPMKRLAFSVAAAAAFTFAACEKHSAAELPEHYQHKGGHQETTTGHETKMSETRAALKRDLDERMVKRKELQDSIEKLNADIKKPELSKDLATAKMKERDDKIGEWQTMMRELQHYQQEKEKELADQMLHIQTAPGHGEKAPAPEHKG